MAAFGANPTAPSVPWKPEALVRLLVTDLVALTLLVIAWFNSSEQLHLGAQVRYLDLAVVAVVVIGAAHTSWLMAGRRAVGERARALTAEVALRCHPAEAVTATADAPTLTVVTPITGYVRAAGMTKVHVPDCPLLQGKSLSVVPVDAGPPCGVCR